MWFSLRLKVEIARLEQAVRSADGKRAATILKKSEQLANYLLTGHHGVNLLRNATAIAHLFGEPGMASTRTPDRQLVDQIDQLTTLYAIRDLDTGTRKTLQSLMQEETEGLEFVTAYLVGQRKDELAKVGGSVARFNHYKGYIPSEPEQGGSLIIAADTEHARLLARG